MDKQNYRDYEAEQAVLASILLEGNKIDDVHFLQPRDFLLPSHRKVFEVMRYLVSKEIPIDLVTVTAEFNKFGRVEDMGSVSYLAQLMSSVPTAANVIWYAKRVKSLALRERGRQAGQRMIELANEDFESDEDYISANEDVIDELRPEEVAKMRGFADTREDYFRHLGSKAEKLKTGLFDQFDSWAQIWRGWLYILAGRPSVGKTAKALMLFLGIAKFNPGAGAVLLYSQEMGENEIKDRMVSMLAEVNYSMLINKGGEYGFTEADWKKIEEAYDEVEKLPLFIQDSAGVTIDEIRTTVKQFIKTHGKVAAVIVDYLQIMEIPQKKGEQRPQAIGRVTKAAKLMARQMNFAFIMLSQLDREADDVEPKLRHLKESGSIEQDADVVEFLWYNPDDQPRDGSKKIINSIFAKGRNVGLNRFWLEFKYWYQKYVEQPRGDYENREKPKKKNQR